MVSNTLADDEKRQLGELVARDPLAYGGPTRWVYIGHGNLILNDADVGRVIGDLANAGYDGSAPLFLAMCGSGGSVVSASPPGERIQKAFDAVEVVAPRDVIDALKVSEIAKAYFASGSVPSNYSRFGRSLLQRIGRYVSGLLH